MANVAVVGAGAWGTALSIHAARKGHSVALWTRDLDVMQTVSRSRENELFLPGFPLPDNVRVTTDEKDSVVGAELVLLVSPSKFLRTVASGLARAIDPKAVV